MTRPVSSETAPQVITLITYAYLSFPLLDIHIYLYSVLYATVKIHCHLPRGTQLHSQATWTSCPDRSSMPIVKAAGVSKDAKVMAKAKETSAPAQRTPSKFAAFSNAMEHSPLGRLPGELRNMIWALALTREEDISLYKENVNFDKENSQSRREYNSTISQALDLMVTCKQVCSETRGLFLSLNHLNNHLQMVGRIDETKVRQSIRLLNEIPTSLCSRSSRVILWQSTFNAHLPDGIPTSSWDAPLIERFTEYSKSIRPFNTYLGVEICYHRWCGRDRYICQRDIPLSGDDCSSVKLVFPINDHSEALKAVHSVYHSKLEALGRHRTHRMCTIRIELDKIVDGLEKAHEMMLDLVRRAYNLPPEVAGS